MSKLLLGVDGGATKTIALISDATGHVLGAGRAGSSDIHAETDPEAAIARVAEAVLEATEQAGTTASALDASVFSLCGADWPEDEALYATSLTRRLALTQEPTVMNDAFGALRAGTSDGVGAALVVGTGAAIAARGPGGQTWFSGERMEGGGASEFGRRAFEQLIRGEYGPGPVPGYRAEALEAFGVESVESLVHEVTRQGGLGRGSLSRLTPVVLQAGSDGDASARAIVAEQGEMLGTYVRLATERVGLAADATIVLAGGVFRHRSKVFFEIIADHLDGFELRQSSVEPVYGAVLAAADLIGARPDIDRLGRSGPDAAFFHTL